MPGLLLGGEILGYKLKVKNPNTAEEWIAFDGQSLGLVDQTQYTVYGLKAGTNYLMSVVAMNFNGEGQFS